jgi:preprotein translocase subunit SecF
MMSKKTSIDSASKANSLGTKVYDFYLKHYKILLVIPFVVLLLAMGQIGYQYAVHGDFVNKGIALKGGISMTVQGTGGLTAEDVQKQLSSQFSKNELSVREIANLGQSGGFIIESDITTTEDRDALVNSVLQLVPDLTSRQYSVEATGPSIGEQLFAQTTKGLFFAFLCMAIVVWFSYKTPFPVFGLIIAIASNMIITLAIFNMTGEKLTGAGIAAFLMVLGYSVDGDILLTSRLLKRADSPFRVRLLSAIKTSFLMMATTAAAVFVAYFFTNSDVIKQIMFILSIGLITSVFITYLQNANLLRLYLERKGEVTIK